MVANLFLTLVGLFLCIIVVPPVELKIRQFISKTYLDDGIRLRWYFGLLAFVCSGVLAVYGTFLFWVWSNR